MLTLFLLEVGTRIIFSFVIDAKILLYGFTIRGAHVGHPRLRIPMRWGYIATIGDKVEDSRGLYFKYYPYQQIRATKKAAPGRRFDVRINNFGFRGDDFTQAKPPGVVRIVTLGASSTFSCENHDDETYPFYLGQALNQRLRREPQGRLARIEVLNLGIPHLDSDNIRALFMSEVLDFDPDIVTFYEGANDTRNIRRSWPHRLLVQASEFLLSCRYLVHLLHTIPASFSESDVRSHIAGKADAFIGNIAEISAACEERGIRFVVVSQQLTSEMFPKETLDDIPYQQEVDIFRGRLAAGRKIRLGGLMLLIHADINRKLRRWARTNGVLYLDLVRRMDGARKRHYLESWVYLSPEGNRFFASELSRVLWPAVTDAAQRLE